MLHLKFTPATDAKMAHALDTGRYALGSLEYRFLKFAIDTIGDENLIWVQSRRYTSPRSLAEAGLMKSVTTAGFGHADAQRLQQVGSPA